MLRRTTVAALTAAASGLALAAGAQTAQGQTQARAGDGRAADRGAALAEARALIRGYPGRLTRQRFSREQNVFLPNTISLRNLRNPDAASATVPTFRGIGPDGKADVWYIITEAADYEVARLLGVNFAPKLEWGVGSPGSQRVTVSGGRMRFRGAVDFRPERRVAPGNAGSSPFPSAFPPAVAQPGAVGDAEWSSMAVLPSGSAVNVAAVANSTGRTDRLRALDRSKGSVRLSLADGWQGGDRYYYHFVTESSDAGAAAIERGVWAPRLGMLPAFGKDFPEDRSALLGFSPNVNGPTGAGNPERQGLNSTIVDGGRAPVNLFPLDPDNTDRSRNNYSPMWDAHLTQWTDAAIASGQRRAIRGFGDLRGLVKAGHVKSFDGSPGMPNPFVMGIKTTGLIINCPVILQPFERVGSDDDSPAARP